MTQSDLIKSNGVVSFKVRENDDDPKFKNALEEVKTNLSTKGLSIKPKITTTKKKMYFSTNIAPILFHAILTGIMISFQVMLNINQIYQLLITDLSQ